MYNIEIDKATFNIVKQRNVDMIVLGIHSRACNSDPQFQCKITFMYSIISLRHDECQYKVDVLTYIQQ
jgi:hypothetical protein